MRPNRYLILLPLISIAAVGGWFAFTQNSKPVLSASGETVNPNGNGPLDGMTFVGALGPDGKPKDIADRFVFANGTFVSEECELRCKYPARPYYVRDAGDKTAFISETRCPYKDAKITWRGTVDGDTIKGESTWTVRRWYWTVENTFEFEGKLVKQSTPIARTQ